jgi:nucleoid DNA-binding protein
MLRQKDLYNRVATKLYNVYHPKDIEKILHTLGEVVLEATSNGESVSLPNLGKFHGKYFKAKTVTKAGIAWLTENTYPIPARFRLKFSASSHAHTEVNKLSQKLENLEKDINK